MRIEKCWKWEPEEYARVLVVNLCPKCALVRMWFSRWYAIKMRMLNDEEKLVKKEEGQIGKWGINCEIFGKKWRDVSSGRNVGEGCATRVRAEGRFGWDGERSSCDLQRVRIVELLQQFGRGSP